MSGIQARVRQRKAVIPQFRRNIASIPAPILGWNARDSLDDMDPRYALTLDNYFPDGSDVKLRNGNVDHVTGITGPVEYLHTSVIGTNEKLIGFANNSAYNVSASGAVGAPLASGFTNNRWVGVNAGANQGERSLYTNGTDAAQSYDGTTWGNANLTGPTKPNGITVANKRLWVYEEGTGEAWYSPPEAVTGALAKFDVGSVSPNGGAIAAINSLSIDGGQGPDDYTVFAMRSGDILIYVGTDPADAANWSLRGVWHAGRPIGNRCLVPFDKDLILISDLGFESILRFTTGGGVSGVPISDNIRNAVSDAAQQFKNNFGWNGLYNPGKRQLIFNIPVLQESDSRQFVMNTISGAWCRFTAVNALTHAIYNGSRYIGVNGKVMRADETFADSGSPISGEIQQPWSYAGVRGRDKHFKQFRVKIRSDSAVEVALGLGVDFVDPIVQTPGTATRPLGAEWDVAQWDVDFWAGGLSNFAEWRGAHRKGFNASILAKTQTNGAEVQFLSSDILYEVASI